MAHLDSKCPKRETAIAISIEDSDRVCSLFKNGDWKILKKIRNHQTKVLQPQ